MNPSRRFFFERMVLGVTGTAVSGSVLFHLMKEGIYQKKWAYELTENWKSNQIEQAWEAIGKKILESYPHMKDFDQLKKVLSQKLNLPLKAFQERISPFEVPRKILVDRFVSAIKKDAQESRLIKVEDWILTEVEGQFFVFTHQIKD